MLKRLADRKRSWILVATIVATLAFGTGQAQSADFGPWQGTVTYDQLIENPAGLEVHSYHVRVAHVLGAVDDPSLGTIATNVAWSFSTHDDFFGTVCSHVETYEGSGVVNGQVSILQQGDGTWSIQSIPEVPDVGVPVTFRQQIFGPIFLCGESPPPEQVTIHLPPVGLITSTQPTADGTQFVGDREPAGPDQTISWSLHRDVVGLPQVPPQITAPANLASGTDPGVCVAALSVLPIFTATGAPTPTVSVTGVPAANVFPRGTTTVTGTATNGVPPDAAASYDVVVDDRENPTLTPPADRTIEATGATGAAVDYAFTVSDNCPGVTVAATPPSGSLFPLGSTTVTGTATDAAGNTAIASFAVDVVDTTPPALGAVPGDITAPATGPSGATVSYATPSATDAVDPSPTVTCVPASGSLFPVGDTVVSCRASDASGNTSPAKTFTVRVTPALPSLSIGDVSRAEGDPGAATAFSFPVTLSYASTRTVTVAFATVNGTATAPSDYTGRSNTLSFAPGQTAKTLVVNVRGDATFEPDEIFTLHLSSPVNATIAKQDGLGTIGNDDPVPALGVSDVSAPERNAGSVAFAFDVTLSNPSSQTVTVDVATLDGTAAAPSDYTARAATLTFAPGQTTKTVNVNVRGDTTYEPTEDFVLHLSNPVNATIADADGTGTIVADDPVPAVSVSDVSSQEGDSGSTPFGFQVTLSNASWKSVTVTVQSANGSANAPSDYTARTLTLTFAPGQTAKVVNVPVRGDTAVEPDETFTVHLSGAVNATIADADGVGTIVNDD